MRFMTLRLCTAAAVSLTLLAAGCTPANRPLSRDFGESVTHNKMVHIVDPHPVYDPQAVPAMAGPRAANAYDRYLQGTTQPLKSESAGTSVGTK